MNEIDFTDCLRVPTRAYSGANGIDETPYLTDLQRDFYTHYLTARREKVFA